MNKILNPIKSLRLSIFFLVLLVCSGLSLLQTAQATPIFHGACVSIPTKQKGIAVLLEKHTKERDVVLCEEDVEDEDETPSYLEQPFNLLSQRTVFFIYSAKHKLPNTFISTNPLFILFRNLRI